MAARTNVPITYLTKDGFNANPATTAIDASNGNTIAAPVGAAALLVEVTNSFAGAKHVIFKGGANPPAQRTGLGDLDRSLAQNEVNLFVLETARFAQADGSISIDFTASTTGTLRAIALPK